MTSARSIQPLVILVVLFAILQPCVPQHFHFPGEGEQESTSNQPGFASMLNPRSHHNLLPLGNSVLQVNSHSHSDAPTLFNVDRAAAPVSIPLSGGLLHPSGFYFFGMVGGQNLSLQVDISYSSLIVPRTGCVGCRIGDRRYNPKASKTSKLISCGDARCHSHINPCGHPRCFKCSSGHNCCRENTDDCAFNVLYGDKSTGNGTLFTDELRIGSFSSNVLLGAMHEESHNFELPYVDGVLGFAFQKGACRPTCFPPVMDIIANQTGLPNRFSMCVTRYGGTLVLGAYEQKLARSAYQFVDIVPAERDSRFIIPAQPEWRVGSRPVKLPAITSAMLSTGTSDIGVSKPTMLALIEHLMTHYCHIEGLCTMTSWFRPLRCSSAADEAVSKMPKITIPLTATVSITLEPEDYLIPLRVVNGEMHRCVAFVATQSLAMKGIGVMLGATVMRRYALAFDRSGRRVGFAPASDDRCGPKTGSEIGLPGKPVKGSGNQTITADSPTVTVPTGEVDANQEEKLETAELCRAQTTCGKCSRQSNCTFGYLTGKCVPEIEATGKPYPFCSGVFCACFVVGRSGWYVGIVIGASIVVGISAIVLLIWRKRRRRSVYQMVNDYEEQDLETF